MTQCYYIVDALLMLGRATGKLNSQHSQRPDLGKPPLSPYIILCTSPRGHIQMVFCLRTPTSEIPTIGIPTILGPITSRSDLQLQWNLKQSCSPRREFPNRMLHTICTRRNWVDSLLLVVGSQTDNLTPDLSFDHNLCFRCPNGNASPFQTSTFQYLSNDITNYYNQWVLSLVIALWRFGNPFGTPTPTMGAHLGGWGFIPSHSLHSREHVMWLLGVPLGPQPYNPLPWSWAQG
jgi:hypothetical protein